MRQFILIAAMVLIPVAVQAEPSRGPVPAANSETAATAPCKTIEASIKADASKTSDGKQEKPDAPKPEEGKADASKLVERPSAIDAAPPRPKADQAGPDQAKSGSNKSSSDKADKAKKRAALEARVVEELHRHGIYW
jgi:hypothetical protein